MDVQVRVRQPRDEVGSEPGQQLPGAAASVTTGVAGSDGASPVGVPAPAAGSVEPAGSVGIADSAAEIQACRLLTRDGLPAGVLIGEPSGRELEVKLDYVTPAYRDSQIARWLFNEGKATFTAAGFTRLVAHAHTTVHRNYLEMMGFRSEGGAFVLDL